MSINIKKYTKEQMAKMMEDAQVEVQELKRVNVALTEQISQMNGEAINKANEIANLKADADVLRNKLADTEVALGRANDEIAFKGANYAEAHPWRNLWAWFPKKLKMA